MTVMQYDGSFAGLLTTIFEVFEYKITSPSICREDAANGSLFANVHVVVTDDVKAKRVYKKIADKLSAKGVKQFEDTFLSEIKGIEEVMLRYVQYLLANQRTIENDYAHPDVLMVQQTSRKVHREKHRMEAFVRFQLTRDQLYYCIIQPDHDVLPLISKHFSSRYADQRWLIYDSRRKYGLYYDGSRVVAVEMNFCDDFNNAETLMEINDEDEALYQQLWKQYFSSINIKARKNSKLHLQHMPKRYWRYLVEKQ